MVAGSLDDVGLDREEPFGKSEIGETDNSYTA